MVYIAAAMSTFEIACWALVRKPCIIGKYWPYYLVLLTRYPTIYNMIHWFAGPMRQTTPQLSSCVPSIFFLNYILIDLGYSKRFETVWKGFCKEFYEKKNQSDAWLMSCLSHWPSKTAYYIVDWQILGHSGRIWV